MNGKLAMRVAVYQSDTAGMAPTERLASLSEATASADARLLLCPEMFMSGYAVPHLYAQYAEARDGAFAKGVAEIAKSTGTAIAYGYPEAADGVIYNAAQCIDADGTTIAHHRKLVIPPGLEIGCFADGDGLTLFELDGIRFGILICYDVEFPEATRATAMAGAQVILAPTALASQWGVVAHCMIPTRSFENGVYLLYANHAGTEGEVSYLGASCIIGPDGKELARAGSDAQIITADVDLARVEAAQARLPYHRDLESLRSRLR